MSHVDSMIADRKSSTCNCNWGCPCQFNALPAHRDCRAIVGTADRPAVHFGDVPLDGLKAVAVFAWPGAIHEGNGEGLA